MNIEKPLLQSGRIEHLDSLRGIAAVCVVMHHTLLSFKGTDQLGINCLLGRGAVLFFFLLSGFVLGRSIDRKPINSTPTYLAYVIRRIFRLYPAIIVAVIFASVIAYHPLPHITGLNQNFPFLWACLSFQLPVHWWLEQILVIKNSIWGLLWTLQIEITCSLLLPLVVRFHPKSTNCKIIFVMILAWFLCPQFLSGISVYSPFSIGMLNFFLVFYLGFLMNRMSGLSEFMTPERSKWVIALGFMALIPTTTQCIFSPDLQGTLILCFLFSALIPCNIKTLKSMLLSRPFLFLGRISYSCYLFHPVGIYLGFWILHRWHPGVIRHPVSIPAMELFLITIAITLPLSSLVESLVERPFNLLGHRLAQKLDD